MLSYFYLFLNKNNYQVDKKFCKNYKALYTIQYKNT